MLRNLYHGSDKVLRRPGFGVGNPYNDFGLGLYCTEKPELAGEWAVSYGRDGYVNKYTLNDDGLRIINLGSPQYCILHWLGMLIGSREFDIPSQTAYQARDYIESEFRIDSQGCDCIVGYRADDAAFTIAQDFLSGRISYGQLRQGLYIAGTERQFVIKSNRAFDRITFTGFDIAWSRDHYPARMARDRKAMQAYREKFAGVMDRGTSGSRGSLSGAAGSGSGIQSGDGAHDVLTDSPDGRGVYEFTQTNALGRKRKAELYIDTIIEERIRSYDPRLQ